MRKGHSSDILVHYQSFEPAYNRGHSGHIQHWLHHRRLLWIDGWQPHLWTHQGLNCNQGCQKGKEGT